MTQTEQFFEKSFKDSSLEIKKSYLKACKWVAKNILANNKVKNVFVEYEINKLKCEVIVKLHCSIDSEIERQNYCKMCKELHNKVFENSFHNCNSCNLISLNKRQKKRLQIRKEYCKENIEK